MQKETRRVRAAHTVGRGAEKTRANGREKKNKEEVTERDMYRRNVCGRNRGLQDDTLS